MRVAVISDVHANRHALDAVLSAIDEESVDAVWCLGDVVGYGPLPNECCDLVRERADLCLIGNHDLVALGELTVTDFNDEAAAAAVWTSERLAESSESFLRGLRPHAEVDGAELFHASARDPVWEYVLTEEAARATFELTSAPLVLVGHSHVALALTSDGAEVAGGLARDGAEVELEGRWLLNPGSTWSAGLQPSAASHIPSRRRRPRCVRRASHRYSRIGSRVANDPGDSSCRRRSRDCGRPRRLRRTFAPCLTSAAQASARPCAATRCAKRRRRAQTRHP